MPEESRYYWVPNVITCGRFACALVLFSGAVWLTLSSADPGHSPPAFGVAMLSCFGAGVLSDWADGWAARKLNAISELGAKLDPMADKALGLSAMILAAAASSYAPIVVAATALIVLWDWWVDQLLARRRPAANRKSTLIAKFGAGMFFLALGLLLTALSPWPQFLSAVSGGYWSYSVGGFLSGVALLWCVVFLALLSGLRNLRAGAVGSVSAADNFHARRRG
jgi:phosphatidylglycerophosphate synthase